MLTVKPTLLLLYGGYQQCDTDHTKIETDVYLYNVELSTWERPILGGSIPMELTYFSACLKSSEGKGEIVLLGCKAGTNELQQYELQPNMQVEYAPKPAPAMEK